MSAHFASWDDRTLDLAVRRFTVGLERREAADLDERTERSDLEEFESVVAAVHLGGLNALEAPPARLLEILERAGREHLASNDAPRASEAIRRQPSSPPRLLPWVGWLAAAAILALFLFPRRSDGPTPLEGRATLIARANDLVRAEWSGTEDPAATKASGDVVWSHAEQEGYMRFRGLAPNDRATNQYQLWVFDKTRADWEAKPVDGGVFDVSGEGEVVVPIDVKLPVGEATLFAVTLEVPGGVVVSERERLVLTASP